MSGCLERKSQSSVRAARVIDGKRGKRMLNVLSEFMIVAMLFFIVLYFGGFFRHE